MINFFYSKVFLHVSLNPILLIQFPNFFERAPKNFIEEQPPKCSLNFCSAEIANKFPKEKEESQKNGQGLKELIAGIFCARVE